MGAMVEQAGGYVCADAPKGGLRGGHIYLDIVSVGATMNILLAAVLCSGMTIIENCAKEPHIVDLANFLNAMGAASRRCTAAAIPSFPIRSKQAPIWRPRQLSAAMC